MTDKNLYIAAKELERNPTDVDLFGNFLERLNRETSVEEISKVLPLDYERITGHALLRIAELLPQTDVDLCLCIALWYYNFGLDEDALKYLHRARDAQPLNLAVLQMEIYLNYGQGADEVLALCKNALNYHPEDRWLQSVKNGIEKTGKLDHMQGPPLRSKWQRAFTN